MDELDTDPQDAHNDPWDDFLGCRIDNSRLRASPSPELLAHWNGCPFCKASRGLYGRPLEQHRPRCRYKGDANSLELGIYNYYKMINEDDRFYLPMLRAYNELPAVKKKLEEITNKVSSPDRAILASR